MADPQTDFSRFDPKALYFLPLGGSGEIGMNLNVYGYGGQWLAVDLGISFADETQPGIEVIMPDPTFLEERRDQLAGLVLTHAHEDHIGAIPYLWKRLKCPMYCTPFTAWLIRAKLAEAGLKDVARIIEIPLGGAIRLGPFDIEFVSLTHSIPEPNALVIRTPLGAVFHTGDWKLDDTPVIGEKPDEAALRALGDSGILAMVCDSTNVLYEGESGSESSIESNLSRLIGEARGRVIVTTFASNVARLSTIARAAAANGRRVALAGRSLDRIVTAAKACGYLTDLPAFVGDEEAAYLPRDQALFIATGCQGEARSALARIAAGQHPNIGLTANDRVIFSSKIIPGNEHTLNELYNVLADKGVEVVTEKDSAVHVSGHPARGELTRMYQWIRPEIAVPVHGEARHLAAHQVLAREMQVPQTVVPHNGSVVRLAPGPAQIVGQAHSGYLALDGLDIVDMAGPAVAERRRMMFNGLINVVLAVDGAGALLAEPTISAQGIPGGEPGAPLFEAIRDAAIRAAEEADAAEARDDGALAEQVRIAVRRVARQKTAKRPPTVVQILRIGAISSPVKGKRKRS